MKNLDLLSRYRNRNRYKIFRPISKKFPYTFLQYKFHFKPMTNLYLKFAATLNSYQINCIHLSL